jgi:hypothetical protein
MAALERSIWREPIEEVPRDRCLSGLERRCLLKHICECHELVQLTMLGAASAQDKGRTLEALSDLQEALRAAERQIARAERCALELLEDEPRG